MATTLARALIRSLVCLLCLTAAAPAFAAPRPAFSLAAPAVADDNDRDKSCRQGARTKAFGWLLVDYGLATAKYVIGLFLIPVGLLLVCVGVVVEIVEAVACG
ncbi:hypothetical protein ACFQ4O_03125 [Methylopila musalis]|uniref:Uncharacterized protein n=1 Tax=Methylopila musalis TaxID=1134781 RepID=A0ABW3Z467_9HYPH